ncbi:MAG: NAD(P)/FAD-dependent oxidoreductase [Phycisphaerales bacterium]
MSPSLYARLAHRHNPVPLEERRRFLKASLAVGAGLLLSNVPGAFARNRTAAQRVVVVGGGFAGLSCAYELRAAGCDVTLVEATNRVGGRVFSLNRSLGTEFIPGRNIEGGAELIGSNHPLWVAYKERFNLEFLDVHESEMDFPIMLDGKLVSGAESAKLYEEMDAALNALNADAAPIDADAPWTSPDAPALDKKSISERLARIECSDLCRAGAAAQLTGDNGVADEKASLLGMLAAIKGGGLEKYWTETEVFRCKGGNNSLSEAFAKNLGDRINTRLPVRSIDVKGDKAVVTCADNRTIECDHVVLAVPPSAWGRIRINPGLPALLSAETGIQMGTNTKYLSHVKKRFWQDHNLDPVALTDDIASWTWDATDAQDQPEHKADKKNEGKQDGKQDEKEPGEEAGKDHGEAENPNPRDNAACLTAFAGGPGAERARTMNTDERKRAYSTLLGKLYPDYGDNVVETRFMDWPAMPFIGAGYSFPAPGQVTTAGPLMARPHAARLHFAGEHTCYKFVGYMEGALQSGVAVARRITRT